MLERILAFFGALVNPHGPIGAVVSPSVTFKERAGLPFGGTHATAAAPTTTFAVEKALLPARILDPAAPVPYSRVRAINAFIEEHYAPLYAPIDSTDLTVLLCAKPELTVWRVTQHVRREARAKVPLTAQQFEQVIQSLQIQASDDFYNQYLETVPGPDPLILDGQVVTAPDGQGGRRVVTGGTQIRGGRREYNAKTKNFVHWDAGFAAQREAAQAELASRPVRNVARAMEAVAGACLPMYRNVGINPRRDRRSAV